MTDFEYSEPAREFRAEIRGWIDANQPAGLVELFDWRLPPLTAGGDTSARDAATSAPAYRIWEERMLGAGLVCPGWPRSAGGSGWTSLQVAILDEECFRAAVPRVTRGLGEFLVGPVIIAHGSPEQTARFLPAIVNGSHIYCQGFSEPESGSDLASLRTRGVVTDDKILLTGQKSWTSGYAEANMMIALCRTDPDAPKHRGLTCVLLELKNNAVTFRPVRQMTGSRQFAETFLDGAVASRDNVIGELGDGWTVANSTLSHERASNVTRQFASVEHEFRSMLSEFRSDDLSAAHWDALADYYADLQLLRTQRLLSLSLIGSGDKSGAHPSVIKLQWSEVHQRFADLAVEIEGKRFLRRPAGDDYALSYLQELFLRVRAETIYMGTSEIQRNVIAERVLGLPRDRVNADY